MCIVIAPLARLQSDILSPDVRDHKACFVECTGFERGKPIGQVLAFTLKTLTGEPPSQEWHYTAHEQLTTWKVEYLDILRDIPETIRKDPPASDYRPSHWKRELKVHNTRYRAHFQPGESPPEHSSAKDSGSDGGSHSPSTAAAARNRSSRTRSNRLQSPGRRDRFKSWAQLSKGQPDYTSVLHHGLHTRNTQPRSSG